MLKSLAPFAARRVTGPFAFFVAWVMDLAILLRQLRRERRGVRSRAWSAAAVQRLREGVSRLTR